MLRRGRLIKEVKEAVVHNIDEELRSSRVGLTGIGHGQSEGLVTQSGAAGVSEFVLNASLAISGLGANSGNIVAGNKNKNEIIVQ